MRCKLKKLFGRTLIKFFRFYVDCSKTAFTVRSIIHSVTLPKDLRKKAKKFAKHNENITVANNNNVCRNSNTTFLK